MKYRAEIDGLRAVAVLPVILFHAGFELFSGGFVGVDIFFVISGYLITTILISDIDKGSFGILSFYERRARRILPALFVVMFVCLPFAWMWMLPSQMKDFSQSLAATSLFMSNVLFWRESDYFAASAEEKPLLHTWSLAVEEQYYFLFPILLLILWRFGRDRVFVSIVILSILSLVLSEWGWRNHATANFYLATSRAWELLSGSIAAFIISKHGIKSNNYYSLLGLIAIILAIFLYDGTTPFPSIYSVVPVLGVVLIILYGGSGTFVARILSIRLMVGIGLISYSAYLWHQPIFAFARIRSLEPPTLETMAVLCCVVVVVSYCSWRYIERPFRNRKFVSNRNIFLISVSGLLFFLIVGLAGHFKQGWPGRLPSSLVESLKDIDRTDLRLGGAGCNFSSELPGELNTSCGVNIDSGRFDVLLIGDSHLDTVGMQILDGFERQGVSAYALSYVGCIPTSGLTRLGADKSYKCAEYNKLVRDYADSHGVKTIVMYARFPLYLSGERYNNGEGGVEEGKSVLMDLVEGDESNSSVMNSSRKARVARRFREDIEDLLQHYNVIVFSPTPEVGWNVPVYYFKQFIFDSKAAPSNLVISHSYSRYLARISNFMNLLNSLENDRLHIYEVHGLFCDKGIGRCFANFGNDLLYRDNNHISPYAANILSRDFISYYEELRLAGALSNTKDR